MKTLIKFAPILVSSISIISPNEFKPVIDRKVLFSTSELGPYNHGYIDTKTIDVTFKHYSTFKKNFIFYFEQDFDQNSTVRESQYDNVTDIIVTSTFTIDLDKMIDRSKLTLRFIIYDYLENRIFDQQILDIDLNFTNETNNPIKTQQYDFAYTWKLTDNVFDGRYEHYSFDNYSETAYFNTYYRLDLSYFDFAYESIFKTYKSAYLYIYRLPDCLKFLDFSNNGGVEFPLKLTFDDHYCHLSFANPLYVDPKTYQMSLYKKKGFLQTKYFYLPVGHLEDLQDMPMHFSLYEIGFARQSFTFTCLFASGQQYIGECNNAGYCVSGGVL